VSAAHRSTDSNSSTGSTASTTTSRHLIVYTDGASRGNPGLAGAGWVIEDLHGKTIHADGRFLGQQTNNVAEYAGVLGGLEAALALGAVRVTLRADSELLVRQLNGQYKVRAPHLAPLFAQARKLLAKFSGATIEHVPRERNAAADAQSNRAIDERL
jgi:ribonuclease HI